MLDVLEHLPDTVAALQRVSELLEPDGMFIITVPAFLLLWTNHDEINHHFTRYTTARFALVAERAGLRVLEQNYFYHWTFPVKVAVRLYERVFNVKPKPARVPPKWINSGQYWLSRLEQKTLSRVPLPLGSSLLAVGKRQ